MKKLIATIIIAITASTAFASCPPLQPYRCVPVGTKMMCGCGL